ncbi:heparinase II/III domain-containing protein [Corynebacterium casei]|uniref:heparinase II/III domain-containing protein n=1 Tax=Corynebacterium casei TaxID=160386 RepID=UPI003FD676A6
MSVEIPESIRGFVADIAEYRAKEAVDKFLNHNQISLDVGQYEDFEPAGFWAASRSRSEGRKAHAWFFLREWNSAVDFLDSETKLNLVRRFKDVYPTWMLSSAEPGTMAYHDETTAQRVINTSVFIRNFESEIAQIGFTDLIERHKETVDLLATEDFYAGLNNHGMFQDISLLVSHVLGFAKDEYEDIAVRRLGAYFDACFTPDGIHTENNPTYHLMVSKSLSQVTNYLKLTGQEHNPEELEKLLTLADTYAAFCLLPNGEFPPISDTKIEKLSVQRARSIFGNEKFVGAITKGRHGNLPTSLNYVAEDSGYAIFRTGWSEDSAFAMLSAAYNNNYHKHSDELSLYVYANGHALLAEAGPNGYQYSDPKTSYAFSSFAHNTLIVDDKGLPRIDEKAHLTTLHKFSDTDVEGRTQRFDGVDWTRRVSADEWESDGRLMITDSIKCETSRNLKLLWHLGPDTVPIIRGNVVEIFSRATNEKLGELYVAGTNIESVRRFYNQVRPNVQGFSFPQMGKSVPAWVIQFEFNSDSVDLDWDFRTRNFQIKNRGITPQSSLWKTFYGEKPVRYLVDKSEGRGDELLFVFSAVNNLFDFTYNYRASLIDFPGNVCYIIDDFGDQGSYYLANNRNFAEFRSVQQAMSHISNDLGIPLEKAYALGSSKGGAGAIIHGVSAGIKHVIAGGPQYKIGTFTKDPHPNILKYISGGNTEEDIYWADHAMREVLEVGNRDTKISVIVGRADGHYKKHALPLGKDAEELGYDVEILPLPGTTHAELGPAFRRVVGSFIAYMQDRLKSLPHAFAVYAEQMKVGLVVVAPPGALVLAQLQLKGKAVGKPVRLINGTAEWDVAEKGVYRVRVYFEAPKGTERKAFGTEPLRLE